MLQESVLRFLLDLHVYVNMTFLELPCKDKVIPVHNVKACEGIYCIYSFR